MAKEYRAIKYRIFPTKGQAELFMKTFGCCRFVYNYYLALQEERYKKGESSLSKEDCNNHCTHVLKEEKEWLREVDSYALTNAIFNLDQARDRFFSGLSNKPKFKSRRRSRFAFKTNYSHDNIKIGHGWIKLPKVKKVKASIHRLPADGWTLKNATVSMDRDGKYYCSVSFEYKEKPQPVPVSKNKTLGLDFKISALYMDSNGECADMPKFYKQSMGRLGKAQKALARKRGYRKGEADSHNFQKQRKKVAKLQRKTANQRRDFLHKVSRQLAEQYDMVCVEDISVKEILESHPYRAYRRSVYDNGWYMFTQMLKYKLEDSGKVFRKIGKDYPSSQVCSTCGHVNPEISDDRIRSWVCPACGTAHDRDRNAAVNIREEGWREYIRAA